MLLFVDGDVTRRAEDGEACQQSSQDQDQDQGEEPEWWGEGLTNEVQDFYRHEV